jgi:hypothetical protein
LKNATQEQIALVKDQVNALGQQEALFDYETLDAENRIVVQQRTLEIQDLVRRTAENVVQIGAKLAEVKQRLDGKFIAWLDKEFSWSERTAYNFIAVHQAFGAEKSIAKIATSALYLLSAPNTPAQARQAAIEMAEAGETVTHKTAKALVEVAKEAAPKTAELFQESEQEEVLLDEKTEQDRRVLEAAPEPKESEAPAIQPVEEALKPSATPKRDKLIAEKAATEAEKLWGAAAIQINIRLMPVDSDPRGRQAIIAMSADDGPPTVSSKRIADLTSEWPPAISELILAFRQKLVDQKAKQAVKPATKKPAAKAAKKSK